MQAVTLHTARPTSTRQNILIGIAFVCVLSAMAWSQWIDEAASADLAASPRPASALWQRGISPRVERSHMNTRAPRYASVDAFFEVDPSANPDEQASTEIPFSPQVL